MNPNSKPLLSDLRSAPLQLGCLGREQPLASLPGEGGCLLKHRLNFCLQFQWNGYATGFGCGHNKWSKELF